MLNDKSEKSILPWILFGIYLIGYFVNSVVIKNQSLSWLGIDVFSLAVSIIILARHRFPRKKSLLISAIIVTIFFISNLYIFNLFTIIQGIILFLASTASCSVFEKYSEESLKWIKGKKKTDVLLSVLIGIAVGLIWGAINYFLMKGSNVIVKADVLKAFVYALNPATMEEVALRTVFYAFCLSCASGRLESKKQRFTAWFMMIIPHIIPHLTFDISNGISGVIMWFIYLALYIVIFGFIFAFLQKKRDITSAMIAHGIVDFIRFILFGVPG